MSFILGHELLTPNEIRYLKQALSGDRPLVLERVWSLMDDAWEECHCTQDVIDEHVAQFYAHPVWLLNGLFVEQDAQSLVFRRHFSAFVASLKPERVADFGGGYGTLARMVGAACPEAEIHIVEPHPHPSAVSLAKNTSNVRYVDELTGQYDVLIATDVFEHVPDPLALVEKTSVFLRMGGTYLVANCFWPVIRCHLPATFHFRWSWNVAMVAMNLQPGEVVSYGRAYMRTGQIAAATARRIEKRSRFWFALIERMPARVRRKVARLLIEGAF